MAEYRNSIRSKKMIREAFAELLKEKEDLNKITVKEIIDRADISKSTFYSHYDDIYNVVEEFESEIVSVIIKATNEYIISHKDDFLPYIDKIIATLKENESLYKMILSSHFPVHFIEKLKRICNQYINKDINLKALSEEPNKRMAQIDFITNGTINLVVDYFRGSINITLDEIGILINDIISRLIK